MKTTQILGSCLVLSFCATASAQSPRIQQSEQFQRRQEITAPAMRLEPGQTVPELYPGESEDVGPQHLLQLKARPTQFEVLVDSQFYWSDNVNYAGSNAERESTVFVNTFQAAYAPRGLTLNGREVLPRIGLRSQWYNYGLDGGNDSFLGSLDFEAHTLFAEGRYYLAQNWQAYLGVEASMLFDQGDYGDDFYSEIAPYWGVQWFWPIGENKLVSAGYRGFYHFSDTETFFTPSNVNDRTDHSLTFSYAHEILPKLVLQPFYRFQYTYYTEVNKRHDLLHELGLALGYRFNNCASVRTFVGYQIKDASSKSFLPDYEKLDAGIGATLVFRF
ncbi:MAG: hypothetical protein H0X66_09315 [Verrucomicrobia bacterium]|nr:hypothetical protein [Verrucomicrobiota bacterium]